MTAVIFEAEVADDARAEYLDLASQLRPPLTDLDGFISVELFQSLTTPDRELSLSFWRDEAAVARWRNLPELRRAQAAGRDHVFAKHRLRIAGVLRDYSMNARGKAPADSRTAHEADGR